MIDPSRPVRGWLLLFVIWMAINVCIGIAVNLMDTFGSWNEEPGLRTAMSGSLALALAWYLFYGWQLFNLVRLKPKSIKWIKIMLLGMPIFTALLPCFFAWLVSLTCPATFGSVVSLLYNPFQWGNIVGTLLISLIWFWYFCVSGRVRLILSNSDRHDV